MMTSTSKEITDFYNNKFVKTQLDRAFNERHFLLLDKIKKIVINKNSTVLEVGCGIGIMTYLVADEITRGKITAIDISNENLLIARLLNSNFPNVTFVNQDILSCNIDTASFDFIFLFDVIEHIPIHLHSELLKILKTKTHHNSKVVINIPSPQHNSYLAKYNPEELQIIDHALESNILINTAYQNGFVLNYFETYDVWLKEQYQFMVFSVKKKYEPITNHRLKRKNYLSINFLKRKFKMKSVINRLRST